MAVAIAVPAVGRITRTASFPSSFGKDLWPYLNRHIEHYEDAA